jgi:hypothetical protein
MTTSLEIPIFRDFNNYIDKELTQTNPRFMNVIDEKIKMTNDFNELVTPEKYNEMFNIIDNAKNKLNVNKEITVNTINHLNQYIDSLNLCLEKNDILTQALNNNRLKFGLKGQIKQYIQRQQELPEMTEEQQHAFQQPYAETPSNVLGRGGRRTRRTRRPKTRRSKTRRSKTRR